MYHALDELLVSGKGQEKAMSWGGGGRVDGMGTGSTIVTALLDRKRGEVGYELPVYRTLLRVVPAV